jgi:hypothetical protein
MADYRPMSDLERARARALGACRFPTACFSKRFARTIAAQATSGEITEKQAAMLERLCWTYRRQIPRELVPAEEPAPVDYSAPRPRRERAATPKASGDGAVSQLSLSELT